MSENVIALKLALSGAASVQAGIKNVSSALAAIRVALPVIVIGAIAREMTQLTAEAINAADAMGKLAQKSGIAVESLSGLSFAAHMGDLSNEEFANSLKFLGKEMAAQGNFAGNLDERLMELSDQFAAMPDGIAKNQIALENFGRAGLQMIPFLNQGSEAIRKQRDEAREFGLVIDEQFAKNADTFNDNVFRLKSSLDGLFLTVARDILPSLILMTDQLIRLVKETGAVAKTAEFLTIQFTLLGKVLKETAEHPFRPWWLNMFNASNATAASLFAQSIVKSLQPVGDALKNALSGPAVKPELISEEDGQKAAKILRELIVLQLAFWDAKLGRMGQEDIRFSDQKEEINRLQIAEAEKNGLLEQAEFVHQQNLSRIHQKGEDERLAREEQNTQARIKLQSDYLQAAGSIAGSLADAARLFGKKGFIAWKAFAVAQAVINGANAVLVQLGGGDPYSAPIRAAAAGIAAAVQVATIIATQPKGYAQGGYTGNAPTNQAVGEVHGREFVFSAPETQRIGVANLQALHDGGSIPAPNVSVAAPNITTAVLFDESAVRQLFKSRAFSDTVINLIRVSKFDLGMA